MERKYKISLTIVLCFLLLIIFSSQKASATAIGNSTANTTSTSCTISFDATGGDGDTASITVTYGSTYDELPEVTRENYVFQGWYTFAKGGNKITATTKVYKPTNHTLYAHWRGDQKEITLDSNGGELSTTTAMVYYGSKYLSQLPSPTKSNYKFVGWYTAATDGDKITSKSIFGDNSDTTLYAHWAEKTIKVILIAFNGESYDVIEVSNGNTYGELPVPVKEGYIFGGWYKRKDYTNYKDTVAIAADTIVDEVGKVTLLARWYIDTSTVSK